MFLEPTQEELKTCERIFEGFRSREANFLVSVDGAESGIEFFDLRYS